MSENTIESCYDKEVEGLIARNSLNATTRLFIEYGYSASVQEVSKIYAGIDYVSEKSLISKYNTNCNLLTALGVPYYQVVVMLRGYYLYFKIYPKNDLAAYYYKLFYLNLLSSPVFKKSSLHFLELSESQWYLWLRFIRTWSLDYEYLYVNNEYHLNNDDFDGIIDVVAARHREFDKDFYMSDIDAIVYVERLNRYLCLEFKHSSAGRNEKQDALYRYIVQHAKDINVKGYRIKYNKRNSILYNFTIDRNYSLSKNDLVLETFLTESDLINALC